MAEHPALCVAAPVSPVRQPDPAVRHSDAAVRRPEAAARQLDQVVERLVRRYAGRSGLHRDVIEAAVRSGWARYDGARVTTYRAILAERAATASLRHWFGGPQPAATAEPGDDARVDRPVSQPTPIPSQI